jgi:hypothetical protein
LSLPAPAPSGSYCKGFVPRSAFAEVFIAYDAVGKLPADVNRAARPATE